MRLNSNQRQEGDKTRSKILKAATTLFAKNGFVKTSTASIAKSAKVNEALIFHHFGNKTELWHKVKFEITEQSKVEAINPSPASLKQFLSEVIHQRISLHEKNPLLYRIKQWQRLEDNKGKLKAENPLAPEHWIPAFKHLQENKQISNRILPEMAVIWLNDSINAVIQDDLKIFHDTNARDAYLELISSGFEKAFAN